MTESQQSRGGASTIIWILCGVLALGGGAWGARLLFAKQKKPVPEIFAIGGVALKGYDPVAYFTQKKPVRGLAKYSHRWRKATWRFASAAHLKRFRKQPAKYAPQYGGYCAWAVSRNYTAPTSPKAWKIVKGKLYLNYNASVAKMWSKAIPKNIRKADKNWPGLHQ